MMFKNIFYEPWKGKMHLWELNDNGETEYKTFNHEIEYYTVDKTGKSEIKSIYNEPVIKHISKNKDALNVLRDSGEKLFESDLSEEVKFLHKRYGDTEDKINYDNFVIANIDIEIQTEDVFPKPELALFPINLITVHLMRTNEIITLGLQPYTGDSKIMKYFHCESESQLIERFCKLLKFKKVDIITGWNTTGSSGGFDIPYLVNRIENLKLKCSLSPINKMNRKNNGDIEIAGIADLDLLQLYKKYTYENKPSYSLNYIGIDEVGEGKLDYEGSLNDLWKRDWNKFVEYNVQDCLLVAKIEKKKKLLELAINFAIQTRTPMNKVFSTVAIAEGYILRYIHKKNMVLPDKNQITSNESIKGAFVQAFPGFYIYNINIDATSLYPSLIRQFNISPETQILSPSNTEGLIKTNIPGLFYTKEFQGIIPEIVTNIFNQRKYNKKLADEYELECNNEKYEYYYSQQLILKILINSFYGAMLQRGFHFFDINNGSCITSMGREMIQFVAKEVNHYLIHEFPKLAEKYYPNFINNISTKNKIALIDTDSNYINLEEIYKSCNTGKSFLDFVLEFEVEFLDPFLNKIMNQFAEKYNTESLIGFKREKVILKQLVQAKKKYATSVIANEKKIYDKPTLKVTGLEVVRSDLSKFSKDSLKKFLNLMFEGEVPDKKILLNHIRNAYKQMKQEDISNIALPKSVGTYDKYDKDISEDIEFEKGTPIFNKASMIYNLIVKENKLPYMEINNGSKMKYVFVRPNNKFNTNVVAFIGNYPKEFNEIFKIDYDMIFEKQYLNIVQRIFDVLEFGQITMKDSNLMKLFDE